METITFDQYFDQVESLKGKVLALERHLQGLEETITDKDKYIKKLESKLKKKDKYIEENKYSVHNAEVEAQNLREELYTVYTKYEAAVTFIENYIKENI